MNEIRKVVKSDIKALKSVLDSIDLFPTDMLDDMISDYFDNPETEDVWFTVVQNETPISIGYCVPEKLTDGTYNLLAIGVQSDLQAKGIGGAMMTFIEDYLKNLSHRVLIVETSSVLEFQSTREFYLKRGYTHEATIRDFWKEGDDKVIFWKKLA